MNEKDKATAAGKKLTEESERQIKAVKSIPKRVAKKIARVAIRVTKKMKAKMGFK